MCWRAYIVQLIAEDVGSFAVVVEDVETIVVVSLTCSMSGEVRVYVADNAKHIATPKKKVEKTTISAVVALSYLGCKLQYTGIGRVKNKRDPSRWEKIFTKMISSGPQNVSGSFLTCFIVDAENAVN